MKKELTLQLVKLDKGTAPDVSGQYWEFYVSGQTLKEYLGIPYSKKVSPFGWFQDQQFQKQGLRLFRFQEKSELIDHRVAFYICAACGDIGCGSVTGKVEDKGDRIVWRDFADTITTEEVGALYDALPIEFDRNDYFKAFAQIR